MQTKKLFIILLIMFFASAAFSLSMGPGRVEYLYKPGLSGQFELTVTENSDNPVDLVVYAEGDLAQYVTINNPNFHLEPNESKVISYSFALPSDLNKYGLNETLIIAKTTIAKKDRTGTISAAVAIAHQFWVHVPYPYVYVEPRIKAENVELDSVKKGDPIFFDVTLFNLGSYDATTKAKFFITNSSNEKIKEFDENTITIKQGEQQILQYDWYPSNPETLAPGIYTANATLNFGGDNPTIASQEFKIGVASVVPSSIEVNDFETGQIAKITVTLESMWSSKIPGAYVNAILLNDKNEAIRTSPNSSSVDVEAWAKRPVDIFIDTAGLDKIKYNLKVTAYYSNTSSDKTFEFDASGKKTIVESTPSAASNGINLDFTSMLLIIIVVIVIIGVIAGLVIFRKKVNK